MNPEENQLLENQIEQALKSLPELPAPPTLASSVMAEIQRREAQPWYRQAWQLWPTPLRIVSFAVLIAAFAGLCLGTWKIAQLEAFQAGLHRAGEWFAGANALWNALNALAGAVVLVAKHLGTGFTIACVLAVAVGYGLCLGLGTVYFRLGFARR
jgi:hypothetical protein